MVSQLFPDHSGSLMPWQYPTSQECQLSAEHLVNATIEDHLRRINCDDCQPGEDDAFFVADLGEVYRRDIEWRARLPRVEPFYAVKCNSDPQVLKLLAELGRCFDCASVAEMQSVLDLDIHPSRIIFANPCKAKSALRFVRSQGVTQMTFDNADELYKIRTHLPKRGTFGAPLDSSAVLLRLAKKLDLNIVGVSFHVGTGGANAESLARAVRDAWEVFGQARAIGYQLHTLDIGGGFISGPSFAKMAACLHRLLNQYFPSNVRIIAEPGRYYVNSAFTCVANIIARRDPRTEPDDSDADGPCMLYPNDGVYGNFLNCIIERHPEPRVFSRNGDTIYSKTEQLC